ncbi:transmembrane protein, putative [Medicago truncatula]|nr:transmembrane protein, putative [Medicago truncatula]
MVSERYGDSDFDPVSNEEDDYDGDDEEDLEAPASATSHSSASQVLVIFNSSGNSVSTPPPSPWIAPVIEGFTIKVGDIPSFLDDSCCIDHESAFDASDKNQKMQDRDSKLIVSAKSKNSTNRDSEFTVSEPAIRNLKHLIIDTFIICFTLVYGVFCFAGK